MGPDRGLRFTLLSALMRGIAWLVPADRRARWSEEWRSEIWHALRRGREESGARIALTRFVLGSFRDAFDARRAARRSARRAGNPGVRDVLAQDLRTALRSLCGSPAFTVLTVVVLALGIGANVAVFSLAREALVGALPFPDDDRLVLVFERRPEQGRDRNPASLPDFVDWREQSSSFDAMATFRGRSRNMAGADRPEVVFGAEVAGAFMDVLGIPPALGRAFSPEERRAGAPVVILAHGLWTDRFGADPDVLGVTIQLDLDPYTVIGVMPEGFEFPVGAAFWYPRTDDPASAGRNSHGFNVVARLSDGSTVESAWTDLDRIAHGLEEQYEGNRGHYAAVYPLRAELLGATSQSLVLLLGAVGLVLLLVCVNVANMELVRSGVRTRAYAIRATMGATRSRILRQQLTESVLVALLSGITAIGVAYLVHDVLTRLTATEVPWSSGLELDSGLLVAVLVITLLAVGLFGLGPALRASRGDLAARLAETSQRSGLGRGTRRWQGALVVTQVALALMLLGGAGLFARNLSGLLGIDLGFDPVGVTAGDLVLPASRYDDSDIVWNFHAELEARLAALPGVEHAALAWILPLSGREVGRNIYIVGRPVPENMDEWSTRVRVVSSDYPATMRMPFRAGRGFEATDGPDAPAVGWVNEMLAARHWPDGDAIGAQVRFSEDGDPVTIVGIVADVRHEGPAFPAQPELYMPIAQQPVDQVSFVLRTEPDRAPSVDVLRAAVRAVDTDQPLADVRRLDTEVLAWIGRTRQLAFLGGVFALVALTLAAVGIYGVVSFSVAQRNREFGLRLALGGPAPRVLGGAMATGMRLIAMGLVVGGLGLIPLSRIAAPLLTAVGPNDPFALGVAAVGLALVGALSVYLPARRATKVDPAETLRAV